MAKAKSEKNVENGTAKGNAPVRKFRARGVTISVFENQAEDGRKFYKAGAPQKTFKDGNNEFKTTSSLGTMDVAVAIELMGQAFAWMLEAEANKNGSEE